MPIQVFQVEIDYEHYGGTSSPSAAGTTPANHNNTNNINSACDPCCDDEDYKQEIPCRSKCYWLCAGVCLAFLLVAWMMTVEVLSVESVGIDTDCVVVVVVVDVAVVAAVVFGDVVISLESPRHQASMPCVSDLLDI